MTTFSGVGCFRNLFAPLGATETTRNNLHLPLSDQEPKHQAMIAAVLVLSLLSLLVATDPEPVGMPVDPSPKPRLPPSRKAASDKEPESDRLAA